MAPFKTSLKIQAVLAAVVIAIFAILPFHAFLTVWASSLLGHYTALRLWKEVLLVGLLAGAAYYLYKDKKLRAVLFSSLVVRLMGLYVLFIVLKTMSGLASGEVSAKAAGYGFIVDSRYIIFFLICVVLAKKTELKKFSIKKWILIPAVIVSAFALLQYLVLPNDFLTHFGYGPDTILPYQTINHDTNYIRAISTMRGANPLGAYLVLIISLALSFLVFTKKKVEKRILISGLVLYTAALIVSFSRSAWIGTALSAATILWLGIKSQQKRNFVILLVAFLVVAGSAGAYALRNNTALDNAIFHTNDRSTVQRSSNQDHASALSDAINDVIHDPFGGGVGSAGPASVYNNQTKIAENYYLQIAQETGWVGILMFLLIITAVGAMLWRQKTEPASLGLFAALVGLSFVSLLSHNWADDTLAYLFFGLSGIVLSPAILSHRPTKPLTRKSTSKKHKSILKN